MPKIEFNQAFSADFSKKVIQLTKDLDGLTKKFQSIGKDARAMSKAISQAKTFQQLTENTKKATEATTKFASSEKKLIKGIQAVRFEMTAEAKQLAILNERKRQAKKANADFAKSQVAAGKSTNTFGKAIKSFLFKANFLANVMANLASTIGRAFVKAVKGAFTVVSEFDGATARLAATTGKTRKEIEGLTKQAKLLGSTTSFTATEVTGLQIELAKLGFTANEITAATSGILDFAAATGGDLAQAAKVAGVAVRAFGLSANETQDVVSTLAVATTKSALAFEDYETILGTVGPVARAYGVTLEDVVALTGKLRDAGFDASSSATALRNILLNLADANGVLAKRLGGAVTDFDSLIDAMIKLDAEGIDLNSTLELTDKRSVAAFNQFLTGAEAARKLKTQVTGVNDQLEEMVETQLDSLPGDVDILKSSWEGLLLTLGSDGPLRFVIQWMTNAILQVSNLTLALKKFHRQSREELSRSFTLLESLTNKQGEHFSQMIDFFDEMTDEQLLSRGVDQIAKDFASIRKISQKEGLALANEYIRRREETAALEIQVEKDKQARIAEEDAKREKLRLKAEQEAAANKKTVFEDVSEQIIALKEEETAALIEGDQEYEAKYSEAWDSIKKANDRALEEIQKAQQEAQQAEIDALNEATKIKDAAFEKEKKQAEELRDLQIKKVEALGQIAADGFAVVAGFQQREIQEVEAKLRANEENEARSATEKAKIEKKLQAEMAKILTKQAKTEKAAAIFSIALSTAVAAMKVTGQTGTGAAIAVPLVLALGAAQLAAVIAEPIPKFEKGVKSSPEGPAWVGEKGSELMIHKGKVGLTPGEPTLMNLRKGTEIVPADITNELLKYSYIKSAMPDESDNTVLLMMNELKGLRREMRSKPVSSSTMTPGGILTATHKGNTTIKKMKRYFM